MHINMNGKMRAPKFDMFAEIRISRAGWKKCMTTPLIANHTSVVT